MAPPGVAKMSLVAQFDDICRYSSVLTEGIEDEFIAFVRKQDNCRKRWNATEKEVQDLQKLLAKSESDNKVLQTKLKHAKSLFEIEMKKRVKIESEKDSLERQITLIREVLLADQNAMNDQTREKLAFLNSVSQANKEQMEPLKRLETIDESVGSLLSPSDISFDKTDDDLDNQPPAVLKPRRSKSKRNGSHSGNSPPKKKKSEEFDGDDCAFGKSGASLMYQSDEIARSLHEAGPAMNTRSKRSSSEPAPTSTSIQSSSILRPICKSESNQLDEIINHPSAPPLNTEHIRNLYTRTLSGSTPVRRFSSAGKLNNRAHIFCTKTVIRPETCLPCGRRIKFYKQALKCQDCRATCHPECKDKVPLPCVPTTHTPTSKGVMGTIADYTPTTPPMIPALIVHCINEIENRGLTEVGLYRVSGSEREVKDLKEKFFRGKGVPNLTRIDIHAVCGTVKEFLRSLREPLITRTLWRDFVQASELDDVEDSLSAIYQAVSQLPQPNRDTLAFVILHLQRVSESLECKMPVDNLAKIFGPTVVGYSTSDPPEADMLTETKYQFMVMEILLNISCDYWNNFVNVETENIFQTVPKTPETRPAPEGSMLGPISSGGRGSWSYKSRGMLLGKTPLTPRNSNAGHKSLKRQQFFSSPLLK